VTPWYLDKALYVMVFGAILPFVSTAIGIPLDPEKVIALVIPVVAYIIAHKAKSGAVLIAEIKARAIEQVAKEPRPAQTPAGAAAALNALGGK
jgi:hypothetical protein